MSESEPSLDLRNIAHKLSHAWSRTLTEADGGDDAFSWRFELWSDISQVTYSLRPEGGPTLTLDVKVSGCTSGEQHLANHRSAWKDGQKEFVSFLREQLRERQDEVNEELENLLWRTRTMDCPIIDSRVFDSVLAERQAVSVECELSRNFSVGFEQEWILGENGYEPNQWQRKVYRDNVEVALSGAQGWLTMKLWSRATVGENDMGLGEYTVYPEEWTSDYPYNLERVCDGGTLALRLARPLEACDEPSEGGEKRVRLAGITITTPSTDWDAPFHPQSGYANCKVDVLLENTLLSPTFAQLDPVWVGTWWPQARNRA